MNTPLRRLACPLTVALVAAGLLPLTASALSYTLTDLGSLTSGDAVATGLNNSATVVGYSASSGGSQPNHAVTFGGGSVADLGTLTTPYTAFSLGQAINDSGTAVGGSFQQNGFSHAFSYSGGVMTDLGIGAGSFNTSIANGINSSGVIVGQASNASNQNLAFSYSGGTTTFLGALGGTSSAANGINDSGTIVGNAFLTGNTFPHAFSYSGGVMTDLGTLGGNASYGLGINSGGVIVGFAEAVASGPLRAFISNNGTMTDLGTLGGTRSAAYDINDSGTVVGQADLANGTQHAFVNLNGGGMEDLNSDVVNLGSFTLVQARGVNESGQIAVWGTDTESGSLHAFLLTPQEVPEASTWAAIAALSLAGVAQWRRSKRA